MYTSSFIVGNIIPKSVKCIQSTTKEFTVGSTISRRNLWVVPTSYGSGVQGLGFRTQDSETVEFYMIQLLNSST